MDSNENQQRNGVVSTNWLAVCVARMKADGRDTLYCQDVRAVGGPECCSLCHDEWDGGYTDPNYSSAQWNGLGVDTCFCCTVSSWVSDNLSSANQ